MSRENVEIIRRGVEAWNRNDLESVSADYAPDVVAVAPDEWPEAETGQTRDALRRQYERIKAPWEEERLVIDELYDLGDRVLALMRWIARGKGSHAEVEQRVATLNTVKDGRVVRVEHFMDHSSALQAAGLSE